VVNVEIGRMIDNRWLVTMSGADYVERMRHMDEVLTEILKNEYGKYLGYYPPVYVMSKCLQLMRPYYLEYENEKEFKKQWSFANFFNNYGHLVEERDTEADQIPRVDNQENFEESPKPKKKQTSFFSRQKTNESPNSEKEQAKRSESIDSPKPQKKSINWFFGNSKNDNDANKKDDSQNKKQKPVEVIKDEDTSLDKHSEMSESIYYPFEDSDIDEDDESDVEGGYDFNHDSDNADTKSIKSEKELTEMYEKELKMKLVENFVNKDTQEKKKSYKRSNSLKKLVNKFKK